MPKYILHGGSEGQPSPMNDAFYELLAQEVPDGGQFLIAYFAWEPADWLKLFERENKRILDIAKVTGKHIRVICANLENFEEQVKASDVIYFFGGNSPKQMENSKQFKHLLKLNKVFAGSSSGAYLMGCKFRTTRTTDILEGTAVLPFNIMAHCDNPKYSSLKESLIALSTPQCPLISLREGEFITIEY